MRKKNAKCNYPDCFAYHFGECSALKRECVEPGCEFYKNIAVWAAENEIALKKLKERGREDLIDQYGSILKDLGIIRKGTGQKEIEGGVNHAGE